MGIILKWLEDNPVGIALGALCGLLLFALLVLSVLAALPTPVAVTPGAGVDDEGLQLPVLAENLPVASYAIITERPLFNENRQPAGRGGDSSGEVLPLDEPAGAPEVELSGVIITPTLRMVTLRRKDNSTSLVAFEGKPIEADFGSWQVSGIQARAVTLTSGSGEELQLELKVHDATIAEPAKSAKPKKNAGEQAAAVAENNKGEPLSRADEIRQRIAERREELRQAADPDGQADTQLNGAADQADAQNGGQADQKSYQQAIQDLIGSKSGKKTNNDKK